MQRSFWTLSIQTSLLPKELVSLTEIIDIVNYIYNERNDTIHSPCKTNSNKEGIKLKKKKGTHPPRFHTVHGVLKARILKWCAIPFSSGPLWPPDAKSWLIWKDPDAGKDWGQEEKGTTEDEMIGWHHQLDGHGFGWTLGVGDGQGSLVCCGSWGRKESDTTERLNWTELNPPPKSLPQ